MCCKSILSIAILLLLVFVVCVTANDDDNNNSSPNIVNEYVSSRRDLKKKKNNGGKPRGKISKNDKRGKKTSKAKSKKAAKNNNIFYKDDTSQPNNTPSPPPPPSSSSEDNTIAPTPVNTQTVGTNKTLAPTPGGLQPTSTEGDCTKDINNRRRLCVKDDCTIDEYEKDPFFVSSTKGKNWLISCGWGLSKEKPFKTLQKAINEYKNAINTRKCQIIYVMEGNYTNNRYEDGAKTSINNVIARLDGVSHLKILKDPEATSTPKLIFNGPGGIIQSGAPISFIEIAHLEIEGPNANITYDMAMEDRYNTVANGYGSNYFRGRGIAIWGGHHVNIHHMIVHHCPNSGIRVNRGDYINITDSRVYSNTWWSSAAESAIVLAESVAIDTENKIKMRLNRNEVFDNMNKIPYYNPNYPWNVSPIAGDIDCSTYPDCRMEVESFLGTYPNLFKDDCPWQCRYGKSSQDYIIDGMGVYVTRNKDTYFHGQMELNDNEAYDNGINGLVYHRTDRGFVQRNKVYNNGLVPLNLTTEVKHDWHQNLGKGRQPYSGIVINNAKGVRLWSNIVKARDENDFAYNMISDGSTAGSITNGGNNAVCEGIVSQRLQNWRNNQGNSLFRTDTSVCVFP